MNPHMSPAGNVPARLKFAMLEFGREDFDRVSNHGCE